MLCTGIILAGRAAQPDQTGCAVGHVSLREFGQRVAHQLLGARIARPGQRHKAGPIHLIGRGQQQNVGGGQGPLRGRHRVEHRFDGGRITADLRLRRQ